MFVSSPLRNMSSNSLAFSSSAMTSSSLSPSSPPTSFPSSKLPIRIARFNEGALDEGRTAAPRECDARELSFGGGCECLPALNRETEGLGGAEARVASSGTS